MDETVYLNLLAMEQKVLADRLPEDFVHYVANHWFWDVAPEKNRQYGIECWERMGPLALLADISACYYRYKKLRQQGATWATSEPLRNAIIDAFGYSVILRVAIHERDDTRHWHLVDHNADPGWFNEQMLTKFWDERKPITGTAADLALGSAVSMWMNG